MIFKINLIIIIIFIQIIIINSLYVFIEGKEKVCVKKYRKLNQILHIIYSISGKEDENKNIITVNGPDDFNMLRELDSVSNKVYLFVEKEGYHKFCVENLANQKVTLNFYFGDENAEGKLSLTNVENFVDSVSKLSKRIDLLKSNLGDSVIRKKTYLEIAQTIRKKINICTIIKIIFILFFVGLQLILITSIFNKTKIDKKKIITNDNDEQKPLKNKT